ncbi:MAG: thioredoxin domain-containing protein, partial [Planctomycetota bacterium]
MLANDSDVESDSLAAVLIQAPSSGTLTLNNDGSFEYTPDPGFVGSDSFTYQASDGELNSNTVAVALTVHSSQAFNVSVDSPEGAIVGQLATPAGLSAPLVFEIEDAATPAELRLAADDHISGEATAGVVLIEYLDLQCPACQFVHSIVEELEVLFPDDLLVVRRHLPLTSVHQNAFEAALAAEAAGRQGRFEEMVDLLFERQELWDSLSDPSSAFESYAAELGLDASTFADDLRDPALEQRIQRDVDAAAALGLASTPSFFLNGQEIQATSSVQAFADLIDAELASPQDAFVIDRFTGEIILANSAALDFDNQPSVEFTVLISDGDATQASVNVTVNLDEAAGSSAAAQAEFQALTLGLDDDGADPSLADDLGREVDEAM